MLKKHYQQQLQILKDLAHEFSLKHPAIAPYLSATSSDPDVERLLQGVAFLTGLVREKLDDDFPEIVHGLMDIIFPHFLRPIPSFCMAAFKPKAGLMDTLQIPAGVSITSSPMQGTECRFRTCFPTEVHPLTLLEAEAEHRPGHLPRLKMTLMLKGRDLSQWNPQTLRFYVGENFEQSTALFMLLTHGLQHIELIPLEGGSVCHLPASALRPSGLDIQNGLFPYPTQSFLGFRLWQEYFAFPQKFFLFDLLHWNRWQARGSGSKFAVHFVLKNAALPVPRLNERQILLFAVPLVNLFAHDADPVLNDHCSERIRIAPTRQGAQHMQIFSVDQVVGIQRGTLARKEYHPLELFHLDEGSNSVYQLVHALSPLDGSPELFLSFPLTPEQPPPQPETLTFRLTCTDGALSEQLRRGDISGRSSDLPELVTLSNVMSPTAWVMPPLGKNLLWKFLSHLAMNFRALYDKESLQNLLELYNYPEGRDKNKIAANLKRIKGLMEVEAGPVDRVVRGALLRGQKVRITARQDHFANLGDLYLFASVMDLFWGTCSPMNSFVQFELKEQLSGESYQWPPRIGGVQLN
jgi:type VI secretion system protein ImpG